MNRHWPVVSDSTADAGRGPEESTYAGSWFSGIGIPVSVCLSETEGEGCAARQNSGATGGTRSVSPTVSVLLLPIEATVSNWRQSERRVAAMVGHAGREGNRQSGSRRVPGRMFVTGTREKPALLGHQEHPQALELGEIVGRKPVSPLIS